MKIAALLSRSPARSRLALVAILAALLALFAWVALRAGPMAPVEVTVAGVEVRAVSPALFGIGTVEARYTHRIGPTFPGRVASVSVQPGDRVVAGQVLAEMDPLDLDEGIAAREAAVRRAGSAVQAAEAQLREAEARERYAAAQARRYAVLAGSGTVSREAHDAKRQEAEVAAAGVASMRANRAAAAAELARVQAERDGLVRQREKLRLVSPVDGLVSRREADAGTTLVAGQAVVEVLEPGSIWIAARFDQQRSAGLRAGLPASVVLHSNAGETLTGRVERVEPHADAVTEEMLAKIAIEPTPALPPSIGELAEVTIALAQAPARPVVPSASLHRIDGRVGVWLVEDARLRFQPVVAGPADLDGNVQVLEGLRGGEQVVAHSARTLDARARIRPVERLAGTPR